MFGDNLNEIVAELRKCRISKMHVNVLPVFFVSLTSTTSYKLFFKESFKNSKMFSKSLIPDAEIL